MRQILTKTKESRFKLYLNFILKPWCFPFQVYIKLNTKIEKHWNNKSTKQVLLNLTSLDMVFKNTFSLRKFNEIDFCEVIT